MAETATRLQRWRTNQFEGLGTQRWRDAAQFVKDKYIIPPGLKRSQMVLQRLRKDLGLKTLQFDPQRWTFVVEGRPVQVHLASRLP